MDTIVTLVVGLIVGLLGTRIVSAQRTTVLQWSMLVGILGAFGGALLGRALGYAARDAMTFLGTVVGAGAAVALYLGTTSRRTT